MNDSDNNRLRLVSDRSPSDDAAVARLLRLAGHRPAVPAQDAAVVKQAARAEWLRTVKAERRRTLAYRGAGGLLAAAALVLLVMGTDLRQRVTRAFAEPVATVAAAEGRATTRGEWLVSQRRLDGSDLAELGPEDALLPGAVVETAAGEPPALLALRMAGVSVRLAAGSRVKILSDRALELERGTVYADSGPGAAAAGRSLEVHTTLGVATDIGTQFAVRFDDRQETLTVRVREGTVSLDREGGPHFVRADGGQGAELALSADGRIARRQIPRHGPSWDWVLEVLPPFDSAGRPLYELLEWAARESGRELRFAPPELERQAREIELPTSTFGRLSPADAVDGAVLSLGGLMRHRWQDDALIVEPGG